MVIGVARARILKLPDRFYEAAAAAMVEAVQVEEMAAAVVDSAVRARGNE